MPSFQARKVTQECATWRIGAPAEHSSISSWKASVPCAGAHRGSRKRRNVPGLFFRHQMPLCTMGVTMGAKVRSGSRARSTSARASSRKATPSRWPASDHPRSAFPRGRDACRSPRHARAEGRRPGRVLRHRAAAASCPGTAISFSDPSQIGVRFLLVLAHECAIGSG